LARDVFADTLPLAALRLRQVWSAGFAAMVPMGRTIYFSAFRAPSDFAIAPLSEQGLFIHELAHVWQARCGVTLAAAKLKALGRAAYSYRVKPGKPFGAYNIEQQAEIVRHLFLARRGVRLAPALDADALEALWAQALTAPGRRGS
jgi:hypothetical protein